MDRFGNILWRRYAQDVFLIALDKPEMCGGGTQPESLSPRPNAEKTVLTAMSAASASSPAAGFALVAHGPDCVKPAHSEM